MHDHDKLCLSKEAAQHVYHAVWNNVPVTLLCINPHKAVKPSSYVTLKGPSSADLQPDMESNLYVQALCDNNDYHFCKDPMKKRKPSELLWSLLSMDVTYALRTTNTTPYLPLYSEWLYDCLDLSKNIDLRVLNGNCSDKFEEIQSTLKISTHFEETSEVSTTYMDKLCPTGRYFEFENQIFV